MSHSLDQAIKNNAEIPVNLSTFTPTSPRTSAEGSSAAHSIGKKDEEIEQERYKRTNEKDDEKYEDKDGEKEEDGDGDSSNVNSSSVFGENISETEAIGDVEI
ncbi:hypothetical protein CC78DRAFT_585015 [Lojkania enalia]|uniref:Uncharacterized protein n=1 Tax=Lojkania enalia TaxID=147567 RepID=A0A9P4N086_9PLEO|nr:hypothetical protein CC78DRAFT_585015 [Didymosphaeria enalia]